MNLPEPIAEAVKPLYEALPLERAMSQLVVTQPGFTKLVNIVERILNTRTFENRSTLAAGLWLYVDELDRSHKISQKIDDTTGSFWHGIVHRREGDFSNSHYWFHRVGRHPAMADIPDYEPHGFVDEVAASQAQAGAQTGKPAPQLVEKQREEWAALFAWCARQ
ncbi:MAG: hypothetical protein HY706_05245 [Candidatus Hydrogenedentes bacterium]|nr:hypothetical protein [Candidatus Hydrogenedentota bacterium]